MTSLLRSEHSFPAVKLVESFHSNNHEPVRDENMICHRTHKFCFICRDYLLRDLFEVKSVNGSLKRSRICGKCESAKNAKIAAKKVNYKARRPKELALIPNPFVKAPKVFIQDQSAFLWSDCV